MTDLDGIELSAAFELSREAQRLVPKGQWLKWLKTEFQWSGSKAYDLMSLPKNLGDWHKCADLDKLDYSAAVELARETSATWARTRCFREIPKVFGISIISR